MFLSRSRLGRSKLQKHSLKLHFGNKYIKWKIVVYDNILIHVCLVVSFQGDSYLSASATLRTIFSKFCQASCNFALCLAVPRLLCDPPPTEGPLGQASSLRWNHVPHVVPPRCLSGGALLCHFATCMQYQVDQEKIQGMCVMCQGISETNCSGSVVHSQMVFAVCIGHSFIFIHSQMALISDMTFLLRLCSFIFQWKKLSKRLLWGRGDGGRIIRGEVFLCSFPNFRGFFFFSKNLNFLFKDVFQNQLFSEKSILKKHTLFFRAVQGPQQN